MAETCFEGSQTLQSKTHLPSHDDAVDWREPSHTDYAVNTDDSEYMVDRDGMAGHDGMASTQYRRQLVGRDSYSRVLVERMSDTLWYDLVNGEASYFDTVEAVERRHVSRSHYLLYREPLHDQFR